MRSDCRDYEAALIGLAEGKPDQGAEAHAVSCKACGRRLAQFRQLLGALAFPMVPAPEGLADRLPQMSDAPRRSIVATLLGNRPALAFRSGEDDLQVMVGAEGLRLRLVYSQEAGQVRVMARLPSSDWRTEEGGDRVDFLASDESQTAFALQSADLRVEVPSLSELRKHGADGAR